MNTALLVTVVAAAVLLVAGITVWCVTRVSRLDRLHRRVDAARAGLGSALGRRVQVAGRVAAVLDGTEPGVPAPGGAGAVPGPPPDGAAAVPGSPPDGAWPDGARPDSAGPNGAGPDVRTARALRDAAATAEASRAPAPDGRDPAGARQAREAAENALTNLLATVDPARLDRMLAAELADAQQLVILARRVHNDAVRDTLGLRSRRLVRWLHLAGTAPVPVYFEIVDPEPARWAPGIADRSTGVGVPGADVDSVGRRSAR